MKGKSLLFALLLAFIAPWAANAQTVTIGTGTSTQNSAPIANYYDLSMAEMIFTADEIGAIDVNTILSLGFQCTTNVSKNYGVTVYMKNIEADAFTATTDFITLSADDVVFTGTVSPTQGWTTIELPAPFTYDRTGNLLIAVNKTSGGYSGSTAIWNYTSTSTTYKMLYSQKDGTSVYDPTTTLSLSLNYNRPNLQLVFGTPATCPKPTMNEAQNVDAESVSLSWTENGEATNWVLQYSTDEDFTNAVTRNRSGIPALAISDLTPLTTYYARVKSDCGGGDQSQWSNVINFTTTAVAQNVGDGWADDFEGTSCGWELINGTLTNAWAWGTAANNGGTHGLYISNDGGTSNAYSHSAAIVYATKLLNFTEGKYEFSYDWKANGESTYDYLRVALVPATVTLTAGTIPSGFSTTGLPSGWIALDGGSKLNLVTAWQSKSLAINVTAGNYYLVMAWRNDGGGGTQPPAAVDNVSITKIACDYDVEDLAVSNITTTTADVTWTDSEVGEWQVALKEGNGEWATLPNTYTTNSATLTGLTTATNYQVKVRAYCNATDQGSWCEAISFASACEAFDLESDDFTENFDDMTAPSVYTPTEHTMPVCWNVINTCTYSSYMYYPTVSSYGSNSTSGSNYLRFYSYYSSWSDYDPQDQYAILPVMENLDGKQIKLSVKGGSTNSTFYVGLMTNPTDPSTFVAFATQAPTTSYVEYEFPISGTGNYIAIKMNAATSTETSHSLYIDDIIVEDAPTCLKPTDLVVTGTTNTTATLSWTNGAPTQTAWQICLNGDETNLIDANSNPFTVEGLTASTHYTAKVRAYCGADDQSEWSDEVSFATACEAITIDETHTYSEGFEGYTGVSYSATDGVMPVCWDSYSTGSVAPHIIGSGSYYYHHDGTNALTFYGSGYCYAAMPEFTNALSELEIKFWMQTESASNGSLVLGYITAEDENYNTFTAIETYANNNNSMVQRTTDLNEVPATATRLVFRWYYSSQYSCCIDDVEVTLIPTCLAPSALEVTATTTTTATFSWTNGDRETAWQICLNGDETNLIPANSNPFTVEDLTASTAYTAKVRAYCSADDQSDWSNEVSFATECEAIVVDAANPFTEGFEGDWTPLCWESIPHIDGTTTRQWTKTTSSSNIHTGAGAAYSGYYGPIYLVMPDLQLGTDGDAVQLTFWSYNTYVNDYDKNSVVLLDGENEIELWSPESVVNSWEETTIDLTAYMGQTISLAFKYEGNNAHGWYVDDVQVAMLKTYTLDITGYGTNPGGYYLIASPIEAVTPTADNGFITNDYDLYAFDESQAGEEWRNWKYNGEGGHFDLVAGQGYLYASKTDTQLQFTGMPYSGSGEVTLQKTDNAPFAGWNLVGNPFNVQAYLDRPFYVMDSDGLGILAEPQSGAIQPKNGVFVIASSDGETATFSTQAQNNGKGNIILNVAQDRGNTIDRAIVSFGQGKVLPKFMLNQSDTKMYIPKDGSDYALVRSNQSDRVHVNFEAAQEGIYTISVNTEGVVVRYLHLIDHKEGIDIDLLRNPNYRFEAKANEKPNRFELVFNTSPSLFKEKKFVAGRGYSDDFCFCNNGNWIINNEGDAILQVIDVNGRILSNEVISGSCIKHIDVVPGIYMLRLINGNDVKVQKVVVK